MRGPAGAVDGLDEDRYVSTGAVPGAVGVGDIVTEAYRLFREDRSGALSPVYPVLSEVDPDRFGICVADVGGALHEAGDTRSSFPVMSVAKPFVFALVCDQIGIDPVRRVVGVNATGLPFDAAGAGNSVRGQHVARFLARRLGLDLLASTPVSPSATPSR
jgi:glutaminase